MNSINDAWEERQRNRWRRPNAHLYIRHDAWRFMPAGSPLYVGREVVKYFEPEFQAVRDALKRGQVLLTRQDTASDPKDDALAHMAPQELAAYRSELLELKALVAELKWQLALRRFARKYSPDQPRVPAGNPDGGQWTSAGGGTGRVRLVARDKPRLGPAAIAAVAAEAARRAIDAFRKENFLQDLFGGRVGTVTYTVFSGEALFGSNSTSSTYDARDLAAARNLRDALVEKYPNIMATDNVGHRPNDAIFHAETTILLRAARVNGGTLAGKKLEVHGDRMLCQSCESVLPYVGLELGNPAVTFVDRSGRRRTMRDGAWLE